MYAYGEAQLLSGEVVGNQREGRGDIKGLADAHYRAEHIHFMKCGGVAEHEVTVDHTNREPTMSHLRLTRSAMMPEMGLQNP